MIEEKDLFVGGVYRVLARNLIGPSVYAGEGIFYGIREKFGEKFTEKEYLDAPRFRPFNTCRPLELVGVIPSDIEIRQSDPTVDRLTGRPVGFDQPVADGGKALRVGGRPGRARAARSAGRGRRRQRHGH